MLKKEVKAIFEKSRKWGWVLEPKVAAANTNFIHYANPVTTATPDRKSVV